MTDNNIELALIQTDIVWENTEANLAKYDVLFSSIHDDVDIVILPEMFVTGFTMNVDSLDKPIGQLAFKWLKNKAYSLGKIIVGSLLFEENQQYYNRLFWMRPNGTYDYYNKRHLFQMGGEHKVMTAGNKPVIVSYKNIKFNLQVCYDLRFPVWSKNTYNKKIDTYKYDVLIYVANWPKLRKQAYMSLLKARAIENQAYVIWVNRVGVDARNITHSGDSMLLNPLGNTQEILPENIEEVLYASINLDELANTRKNFKVGLDWDNFSLH